MKRPRSRPREGTTTAPLPPAPAQAEDERLFTCPDRDATGFAPSGR